MPMTETIYLIAFGIAVAFGTFYYRRNRRTKLELIEANLTIEQYQKDKNELVSDIGIILEEKDFIKKTEIVTKWKFKFDCDKNFMRNSRNMFQNIGGGIMAQVRK